MQRELDALVRNLDRKILVGWVPEMRRGKPAYDHLMACVRGTNLTRHQRANALHALFQLRLHGSEEEVFAVLRAHASHSEIRVRSEAVKLLLGMMRLHRLRAPFNPDSCINEITAGMALGVYAPVASNANDLLERQFTTRKMRT